MLSGIHFHEGHISPVTVIAYDFVQTTRRCPTASSGNAVVSSRAALHHPAPATGASYPSGCFGSVTPGTSAGSGRAGGVMVCVESRHHSARAPKRLRTQSCRSFTVLMAPPSSPAAHTGMRIMESVVTPPRHVNDAEPPPCKSFTKLRRTGAITEADRSPLMATYSSGITLATLSATRHAAMTPSSVVEDRYGGIGTTHGRGMHDIMPKDDS